MSTIKEREFLVTELTPRMSGFTPRRITKLTEQGLPKCMVNVECNHLLRTSREESTHGYPSVEFQLWREAGKHEPPFPKQMDKHYNSNVWRNFRTNYSYSLSTKGRSTGESVAAAYPVNIPKPSKIGDYTYARFLTETPQLIRDDRLREIAISRTTIDKHAMDLLKLKSNCRYPPIDQDGNILPPEHYKNHPHFFRPIADLPTTENLLEKMKSTPPTPYGYNELHRKYQPSKSPAWRFNLKPTNKHHQRLVEEMGNRGKSAVSRAKTCTPATSTAPSEGLGQG